MTDLLEPDPIGADRRRVRKESTLPPDAACAVCGIQHVDVLGVYPGLLEAHHVFGRGAASDATVVLCRNHHAVQTGLQHDHDALPPLGKGRRPDSSLEQIARALTSFALFLHTVAHVLLDFAARMRDGVAALDADFAGWRENPAFG